MVKTDKIMAGFLFLLTLSVTVNAQEPTKADAVAAFNAAANLLQSDTLKAIKAFEDCYVICGKVGNDADSLKAIAAKKLPNLYFDIASKKVQAKQYAEAAAAYEEVVIVAQKYGDDEIATKAKNNLPQLYFGAGLTDYNAKNDTEAIKNLDKTISLDPNFTKAYYLSAAVYRRKGDKEKFEASIDKAIEVSKSTGDKKTEDDAIKLAKNFFQNSYVKAIQANKNTEAIGSLKSALKYSPEDKDLTFYLGQAYNKSGEYDLAIETLNKGIELDKGDEIAKARYYFEIGNAYKAKKENEKACEAYKNAQYGKYAENAKYEITVTLKCK